MHAQHMHRFNMLCERARACTGGRTLTAAWGQTPLHQGTLCMYQITAAAAGNGRRRRPSFPSVVLLRYVHNLTTHQLPVMYMRALAAGPLKGSGTVSGLAAKAFCYVARWRAAVGCQVPTLPARLLQLPCQTCTSARPERNGPLAAARARQPPTAATPPWPAAAAAAPRQQQHRQDAPRRR